MSATHDLVSKNFLKFREDVGLSQADAAELGGVSVSSLSKIEQGARGVPRAATLERFAEIYGRKVGDFFAESPAPLSEEALLGRAVWRVRVLPGFEPDADLAAKLEEFVKNLNREQIARLRRRAQKVAPARK